MGWNNLAQRMRRRPSLGVWIPVAIERKNSREWHTAGLARGNYIINIMHGEKARGQRSVGRGMGKDEAAADKNNIQMERKNFHKKNASSTATPTTARTKKTSTSKDKSEKTLGKINQRALEVRMKKRMSFESPSRKDSAANAEDYHKYSLLNYMLLKEKTPKAPPMSKEAFTIKEILGKGGFGRVYKVEQKRTKAIFAMKEMSKTVIITKKSIQSVLNERHLLEDLKHPYLVNMVYAFQDRVNLYLILEYMPGGDLRFQIGRFQTFPQHIVKFFVCCTLLALQYLHANNVIHRDIKPQNLIFDSKGYLRLTDLGVARVHDSNNSKDTSGTPGYMAPEVINRENHSYAVDYFALGVIAYQCMLGRRPYKGFNRQEIREQMLLFEASIKPSQIPLNWSPHSMSFINGLLKRKCSERLGWRGIDQVMCHPWFSEINWSKMASKKYPSPFLPDMNNRNYDTVSVSEYDEDMMDRLAQNGLLLKKQSVQDLFQKYEYEEVKMS